MVLTWKHGVFVGRSWKLEADVLIWWCHLEVVNWCFINQMNWISVDADSISAVIFSPLQIHSLLLGYKLNEKLNVSACVESDFFIQPWMCFCCRCDLVLGCNETNFNIWWNYFSKKKKKKLKNGFYSKKYLVVLPVNLYKFSLFCNFFSYFEILLLYYSWLSWEYFTLIERNDKVTFGNIFCLFVLLCNTISTVNKVRIQI